MSSDEDGFTSMFSPIRAAFDLCNRARRPDRNRQLLLGARCALFWVALTSVAVSGCERPYGEPERDETARTEAASSAAAPSSTGSSSSTDSPPPNTSASSDQTPSTGSPADASSVPDLPTDPIAFVPEGDPPKGGWPTVALMHGYRAGPGDLAPIAEIARDVGMAAISLPAPLERGEGHYHWKRGHPGHTHRYVQRHLAGFQASTRGELNLDGVWLVGFSQGALHGLHLVADHPDRYRGLLGLSPAGWTPVPEKIGASNRRLRFVVTGGRAEPSQYRETFLAARRLLEQSDVELTVVQHEGGHAFPPDWKELARRTFEAWLSNR